MKAFLRKIFVMPIIFYQRCISPYTPKACRFQPTCSQYCKQAILAHGVIKGLFLGIVRICKCHPFYHGKHSDPVPPPKERSK